MLNKNFFISAFFIFLLIILPKVSLASSISLQSTSTNIDVGNNFNVLVYIDPLSSVSYTAEVKIDFPSELVSIESFEYDPVWIPVNQPEYDLIDNDNGKLVKTAGYPGGFSEKILFGTFVLKTEKSGTIDLNVNNESKILDVDGNNTLSDYNSFSVVSNGVSTNNTYLLIGLIVIIIISSFYYYSSKKNKKIL